MENLVDRLTTLGVVLVFWGVGYTVRLFAGFKNVRKQMKSWNWVQFRDGLFDRFCWLIATVGAVVGCEMAKWLFPSIGITFSEEVTLILDTASVIAIPFVNGVADLVLGIKSIRSSSGWENNVKSLEADLDGLDVNYSSIANDTYKTIQSVLTKVFQPPESAEEQEKFEKEGGRGTYYSVPITNYSRFRDNVIGKAFDLDSKWGAQCYDGAALLWQQLGMTLLTGNGKASGCWTLEKAHNAGTQFELITDKTKIQLGDVVVFGMGEFGHIGFANEAYHGLDYIALLGQNQGGVAYPNGGSAFNIVNVSLSTFLGAFRYKDWSGTPAPAPSNPAPSKPGAKVEYKQGEKVKIKKYVDIYGTPLAKLQKTYVIRQVGPNSVPSLKNTLVLVTNDGDIYARVSIDNVEKA